MNEEAIVKLIVSNLSWRNEKIKEIEYDGKLRLVLIDRDGAVFRVHLEHLGYVGEGESAALVRGEGEEG